MKSRVGTSLPPFKGEKIHPVLTYVNVGSTPPFPMGKGGVDPASQPQVNANKHLHNLPSPLRGGVTRRGRKFTLRGLKRNYILCYLREMIETYTQENFRIYHIQNRIMHMTADQIGLNIERSKGSILAIMKRISRGGQRSRAKRFTQRRSTRKVFPLRPPLR